MYCTSRHVCPCLGMYAHCPRPIATYTIIQYRSRPQIDQPPLSMVSLDQPPLSTLSSRPTAAIHDISRPTTATHDILSTNHRYPLHLSTNHRCRGISRPMTAGPITFWASWDHCHLLPYARKRKLSSQTRNHTQTKSYHNLTARNKQRPPPYFD